MGWRSRAACGERAEGPRPLLVAMTGFGQDEDRARTAAAGFDHHLTKPVDLQLLNTLDANRPEPGPVVRGRFFCGERGTEVNSPYGTCEPPRI